MQYKLWTPLFALSLTACGSSVPPSPDTSAMPNPPIISTSSRSVTTSSSASSAASAPSDAHLAKALNDTGTNFCRAINNVTENCLTAPSQDGNHGRDFLAANGELAKTGAGPLGFDWTKIASTGEPLANQQLAWVDRGSEEASTLWACVQDNNTGLLWEVKSGDASSPHFYELKYSWYSADNNTNGGNAGRENTNDCNGVACNTQAYIDYLNNLNYCGSSQWRLPTVNELMTIVVTANLDLVVDEGYFSYTKNDQYLSSQTVAFDRASAWYLYFSDGSTGYSPKTSPNYVRLVSKEVQ